MFIQMEYLMFQQSLKVKNYYDPRATSFTASS